MSLNIISINFLGVMSGCYHVCPNHTNFQFDTAFMYTISVLILLTIYQTRHPDINANAYTAFGVLVRIFVQNYLYPQVGLFVLSLFFVNKRTHLSNTTS